MFSRPLRYISQLPRAKLNGMATSLSLFSSLNVLAPVAAVRPIWFVTEHVWRIGAVAEPVPIALPAMPVRATDAHSR